TSDNSLLDLVRHGLESFKNIIDTCEIIGMVKIDVCHDGKIRFVFQEMPPIFTRFKYKIFTVDMAFACSVPDEIGNGIGMIENMCQEACCGCLAMCPGNSDACILFQPFPEKIMIPIKGDSHSFGSTYFRIVIREGISSYNDIVFPDVFF